MRGFRRSPSALLVVALMAVACGSGGGEDVGGTPTVTTGPTGATTGATGEATGTTGATPGNLDACALVNEADATAALLGTDVERVEDPIAEDLLNQPAVGTFESVCYFRPVPDDGDRMVATIVFTPGSISDDQFEDIVADGSARGGGHNFEAWEVEDAIFVRKGEVILLVRAVIRPGGAPDEATEFALASLAAARVTLEPSGPEIAACGLLTSEIVTAALGGGAIVPSGGSEIDDQTTACGFAGATESVVVVLYLTTGPLAATRFTDFKETESAREEFEEIVGLGDDAFQGSQGIVVLVGETLVDVQVMVDSYGTDIDAARTMAEAVVGSL